MSADPPTGSPLDMSAVLPPESLLPSGALAAGGNALPPGTRMGEFVLTGVIGEGGFGIVYRARDQLLERDVAIKEYMPSALAQRTRGARMEARTEQVAETFHAGRMKFIDEARLLARFDHPSLARALRFWEANGTAYMVMPYYRGPTLRNAVRAMAAPPGEQWLRQLLRPLLEALETIHAANCWHRDIAPDNILLLDNGQPILLDFGAARQVIGDMTQSLTVIVKPSYAPLEQYASGPEMRQGPWTDVYALAAVVYFCATGQAPPSAVSRMMRDTIEPMAAASQGRLSETFCRAIDHALAVQIDDRTQSIPAFRAELGMAGTSPLHEPPPADDRTVVLPRAGRFGQPALPTAAAADPFGPYSGDLAAMPGIASADFPDGPTLAPPAPPGAMAASPIHHGDDPEPTVLADVTGRPHAGGGTEAATGLAGPASTATRTPTQTPVRPPTSSSASTSAATGPAQPEPSGSRSAVLGVAGFGLLLGAVAVGAWLMLKPGDGSRLDDVRKHGDSASTADDTQQRGSPAIDKSAESTQTDRTPRGEPAPPIPPPVQVTTPMPQPPPAEFSIDRVLAQVYEDRDPDWTVSASPRSGTVRIKRDSIGFSVRSARGGHVYVLMLGTEHAKPVLLFPNEIDRANTIRPGATLNLPRSSWTLLAAGPPGVNEFVVLVTSSPRTFDQSGLGADASFDVDTLRRSPERAARLLTGEPRGCDETPANCAAYGAARFTIQETR